LTDNETLIAQELLSAQGRIVDLGGYFKPDDVKTTASMRPSQTLNHILDSM
jgi:isocitrate dehydrogenase